MAAKSECLEPPGMDESPELSEPIAVATCKACRRTLPLSDMAKNGSSLGCNISGVIANLVIIGDL